MRPNRDRRELTERNKQMLRMRLSHKTFREVAEHFGVSEVRAFIICHRENDRQLLESHHGISNMTLLTRFG